RNELVYAAAGTAGIEVFDVSDPIVPLLVRRIDTDGSAGGLAIEDDIMVVADWNEVLAYRLTDPRDPTRIGAQKAYDRQGRPDALGRILDVALEDGLIYMAEWTSLQAHRIVTNASAPDLNTASFFEFERTAPGSSATGGVAFRNFGEVPLQLTELRTEGPFEVRLSTRVIPPGEQALAELSFAPVASTEARGGLLVSSDDPDEPQVWIELKGNLPGLRPGDEVPELALTSLDGRQTVRLSELRGRPVLLAYFATF
ncbi:MAG: hypothetical protein AAFN74_17575, partial [Myxococcota bacterium]